MYIHKYIKNSYLSSRTWVDTLAQEYPSFVPYFIVNGTSQSSKLRVAL